MNFRESYKKANEEIKGDMSILDGIYEPKKKVKTLYFYKMTTVAAAFILIGTVILMPSFKENIKPVNENLKEERIIEEDKGSFKFMAKEEAIVNSTSEENEKIVVNEASIEETLDESAVIEDAYVPAVIKEENEVLSLSLETEINEEVPGPEMAYDTSENMASGSAGGGGGSSKMAVFSVSPTSLNEELMNTGEVLLLIGASKEKLTIEDMELNIPENVEVTFDENGEIESFVINFSLSGKDCEIEGILINSVTPVTARTEKDGGVISAGKTFGNTDIFIKAYNMEIEKVEEFLSRFN